MALEAISCSSNELFNIVIYDTISATPTPANPNSLSILSPLNNNNNVDHHYHHHDQPVLNINGSDQRIGEGATATAAEQEPDAPQESKGSGGGNRRLAVGPTAAGAVRKKRRRKPRVCKNKEEAETQRMTHIAVERNRRKQMNEHLAVLRSLMPESYVQRGDQASIVGGAIEFVKELEHLLQSLEAQKLQLNLQGINSNKNNIGVSNHDHDDDHNHNDHHDNQDNIALLDMMWSKMLPPPFSQFFVYPQYTWSQISNKYTSKTKAAIADIEVTLIETHASLRILSRRSERQLSKLVAGFHTLHLTILHLNVTTIGPLVLYSVSVKVEEECLLNSVDDIAAAVHHMLRIIEEEAALC